MKFGRFELGQKFIGKNHPNWTAEVVQLYDDGREATLDIRIDWVLRSLRPRESLMTYLSITGGSSRATGESSSHRNFHRHLKAGIG